jgi:hypothetical protein
MRKDAKAPVGNFKLRQDVCMREKERRVWLSNKDKVKKKKEVTIANDLRFDIRILGFRVQVQFQRF